MFHTRLEFVNAQSDVVVHVFSPSTQKQAGRCFELKTNLVCIVQGQPVRSYIVRSYLKKKKTKRNKKNYTLVINNEVIRA